MILPNIKNIKMVLKYFEDNPESDAFTLANGHTFPRSNIDSLHVILKKLETKMDKQKKENWDNFVENQVMNLVRHVPVVQEAVQVLEHFHLYMEQGFMDELKAKLNPGVFDDYMGKIEKVLKELKCN